MSLKAKIEAVIYASEEPVTLSQLTGLLAHEGQMELDRLNSAQQALQLDLQPDTGTQQDDPAPPGDIAPEPTEPQPSQEPGPLEESPAPEHPVGPANAPPQHEPAAEEETAAPTGKQQERARERKLRDYFRMLLDELIADYARSDRGLEIREVAGGFRVGTKPEYHDAVRGFVRSLKPPLKLSLQALETLAVIAYKQPVTAPEISEIRGVDSGGVLGSLMARKLITTAGRKQVIGRPILYKTTRDFLLRFGLKDVSELPSIEEFEKMAGELADNEPAQLLQEEHLMAHQSARELDDELAELTKPDQEPEPQAGGPQPDGTSIPLSGSDESSSGVPGNTVATPEGDGENHHFREAGAPSAPRPYRG